MVEIECPSGKFLLVEDFGKGTDKKEALVFQAENIEVEWLTSGISDYRLVFRKPAVCEFEPETERLFCKTEVTV